MGVHLTGGRTLTSRGSQGIADLASAKGAGTVAAETKVSWARGCQDTVTPTDLATRFAQSVLGVTDQVSTGQTTPIEKRYVSNSKVYGTPKGDTGHGQGFEAVATATSSYSCNNRSSMVLDGQNDRVARRLAKWKSKLKKKGKSATLVNLRRRTFDSATVGRRRAKRPHREIDFLETRRKEVNAINGI